MTMYILDNTDIVNALVSQINKGIDVEVVLNQTFPSGTTESNPTTYSTLNGAKAGTAVWRNGPVGGTGTGNYTHEKTFIVDGATAWIMTINLDTSSFEDNREYVAIDTDASDVAEAEAVFTADFTGGTTSDGSPLVVSPTNSRVALVDLIDSATKTLDLEVEEFSDTYSTGITNAVAAAAKRGVKTRLILANSTPSSDQTSSIATVKAAGVSVVVSGGADGSSSSSNPYIHAKAITVDCSGTTCASGFIGSENFTGGALGYNRELGVVIDNVTQLALVETAINSDFAKGTAQ
jgi:phosphatidylserine/phosphatidylglycerophosphate/cardiolipin synthase-like enzyme